MNKKIERKDGEPKEPRIYIKKEKTSPMTMRKSDRLLISSAAEIELIDVKVAPSLDYEISLIITTESSTRMIRLGPRSKLVSMEASSDQQGQQTSKKDRTYIN